MNDTGTHVGASLDDSRRGHAAWSTHTGSDINIGRASRVFGFQGGQPTRAVLGRGYVQVHRLCVAPLALAYARHDV
jgi:hypothetical protein